jgi:homoserine kinase type II
MMYLAVPLKHSGQAVHFIAGKPAQIAPRLMGHHPMQTTVAKLLQLQMHRRSYMLYKIFLEREYRRDHQYWTGVAEQLKPNMTQDDKTYLSRFIKL